MRTQHLGPGAVGTVLVLGALVGCTPDGVACPAIGYGNALEVRLADGWPGREHLALDVWCTDRDAEWCQVFPSGAVVLTAPSEVPVPAPSAGVPTARTAPPADPAAARRPQPTEPADRWSGTITFAPDELNVRVWDVRTATVVADLDLAPDWVVESDGPCGGPARATIELPPA